MHYSVLCTGMLTARCTSILDTDERQVLDGDTTVVAIEVLPARRFMFTMLVSPSRPCYPAVSGMDVDPAASMPVQCEP